MNAVRTLLAVIGLSMLAACGGGGDRAADGSAPSGVISGNVTKGPVHNATGTANVIEGGQKGAQLATARTDGDGNFTLSIGGHAGPVMLQASGAAIPTKRRAQP